VTAPPPRSLLQHGFDCRKAGSTLTHTGPTRMAREALNRRTRSAANAGGSAARRLIHPLPRVRRSGIESCEAPVAQLDRALPSEGRGHRFESCRARQSNQPLIQNRLKAREGQTHHKLTNRNGCIGVCSAATLSQPSDACSSFKGSSPRTWSYAKAFPDLARVAPTRSCRPSQSSKASRRPAGYLWLGEAPSARD
jgi:hypothetical protein